MVHKSWLKNFTFSGILDYTFEYQLLASTNLSIFHFGTTN